jgi:hypothetical protein
MSYIYTSGIKCGHFLTKYFFQYEVMFIFGLFQNYDINTSFFYDEMCLNAFTIKNNMYLLQLWDFLSNYLVIIEIHY